MKLEPGAKVKTPDNTNATFVRYLGEGNAVILVGLDSRVVPAMILRRDES